MQVCDCDMSVSTLAGSPQDLAMTCAWNLFKVKKSCAVNVVNITLSS